MFDYSGRMIRPTNLADLVKNGVLSGATASERNLALLPTVQGLLPHAALQRGTILSCEGRAAVSLALVLAAGPSHAGAWVAVAGFPSLGLAAAVELGIVPSRLVMVAEPADRFNETTWADALAAMIDGFDVLLLGSGAMRVQAAIARRLIARNQARGAVIITVGNSSVFGADFRFEATDTSWRGLGDGHGVADSRQTRVLLSGRRVPRPRHVELLLPAADGRPQLIATHQAATILSPTG